MSDTKFTPGPWTYGDWVNKRVGVEGSAGWVDVWRESGGGLPFVGVKHENELANAALIAAATELYAALELMSAHYSGSLDHQPAYVKPGRAALAKARGEQA